MTDNYDDIINLPHPTSKRHKRMSMYQRAAQFAPFAALTGHAEVLQETARLTDEKLDHDESLSATLDMLINTLRERLNEQPTIRFTYFVADMKKDGGKYIELFSQVKDIDDYNNELVLIDNKRININDIYDISIIND